MREREEEGSTGLLASKWLAHSGMPVPAQGRRAFGRHRRRGARAGPAEPALPTASGWLSEIPPQCGMRVPRMLSLRPGLQK